MRHLLEFQKALQIGQIAEKLDDAAVIGLEELFQNQEREELMLGEIFLRKFRGMGRQSVAGNPQGHPGQRHWRTRHASFGFHEPWIVN